MNILITGGAGFIASHLADKLIEDNVVICVDNLELGKKENVIHLQKYENFHFYEFDINDEKKLCDIIKKHKIEYIYHLAANSDIQKSAKNPNIDFKNTFNTTKSVLECMRICNIKNLFFASTSAVYGDKTNQLLDERTGELRPISYYGGAKLASEAFISSYAYMNDLNVLIFRFPNVIGPRLTHGVIHDFIKKLKDNPTKLEILGDGTQCKPYIHVYDLIHGIMQLSHKKDKGVRLYNIGVETATTVTKIADMICESLNLENVEYHYTGGNIGWKGDVPSFKYCMKKIYNEGWYPKYSSDEAVKYTIESIIHKGSES